MKTVTVIVPIYNAELYLEECLDSLVNQSFPFDEIILIDDGSTDQSREICARYFQEYFYIKLITQKNKGQGIARNVGIDNVIGEYLIFVDSDDYVTLDMCQRIKEGICREKVDVLYYNASIQYDIPTSEKNMTHSMELDYQKMSGKEYLYKAFPESYSSAVYLAVYRTCFLKKRKINFPEKVYFEDNLFSLRVALEAQTISCIPNNLYIRRCRANSIMTGKVSEKKGADMVLVQQSMWIYLQEKAVDKESINFTNRFISAGMLFAIGYLAKATDERVKKIQTEKLIQIFLEMWVSLFFVEKVSIDQLATFLTIFQEIEKWDEKKHNIIIDKFWGDKKPYMKMKNKFEEQLSNEIIDRMMRLPLYKKGCRIGIYGIGRHTQALLNLYQKLAGEIQCGLFFVVTEKTTEKVFNCPVLAVTECRGLVDEIIISSKLYQQEMKENLIKEGFEENKIILLYQQGEVCDLVTIEEVLSCNEK